MKKTFTLLFILCLIGFVGAQCIPSAYAEIDTNGIRAGLMNGGTKWHKITPSFQALYGPKGPGNTVEYNTLFTGGIWLSGLEDDSLKVAGMTYFNEGHDFYTGPISLTSGIVDTQKCTFFNRFFEARIDEVESFLDLIQTSPLPLPQQSIPLRILEWPAKGNTYLESLGIEIIDPLAPFIDLNNNGIYEPEWGDYPLFKGHQAQFWVMNDAAGPHSRSGGQPLNVEIHAMAYSFSDIASNINMTTYYDYTITKKTPGTISDAYFSLFVDSKMCFIQDSKVGCDTLENYAFITNNDNSCHSMFQTQLIKMTEANNNTNLSSFLYLNNGIIGNTVDPNTPSELRNLQLGLSRNGEHLKFGGPGNNTVTSANDVPTKFIFPSNPALCNEIGNWSDYKYNHLDSVCNLFPLPYSDRRLLMSSGPYLLNFNQPITFSFSSTSINYENFSGAPINTDSVITPAANDVQDYYDTYAKNGNIFNVELPNSLTNIVENSLKTMIIPNPANEFFTIQSNIEYNKVALFDFSGKQLIEYSKSEKYDVQNLPAGIYFIQLRGNVQHVSQNTKLVLIK